MTSWNQKAALTDAEQEKLDNISNLFTNFKRKVPKTEENDEGPSLVEQTQRPKGLKEMVGDLKETMGHHENLAL
jgi:hypothetical protein